MRRRLTIVCLCLAWICANGAIWDAVQVVAWGRMFASNVRVEPLSEALRDTFDPAKPCPLCRAVSKARVGEQKNQPASPVGSEKGKLLLASEESPAITLTMPVREWSELAQPFLVAQSKSVPVPPPRA